MKGQIIDLKEIFDDIECKTKYQAVVWFDDMPDLKLGGGELLNVKVSKNKLRDLLRRQG